MGANRKKRDERKRGEKLGVVLGDGERLEESKQEQDRRGGYWIGLTLSAPTKELLIGS